MIRSPFIFSSCIFSLFLFTLCLIGCSKSSYHRKSATPDTSTTPFEEKPSTIARKKSNESYTYQDPYLTSPEASGISYQRPEKRIKKLSNIKPKSSRFDHKKESGFRKSSSGVKGKDHRFENPDIEEETKKRKAEHLSITGKGANTQSTIRSVAGNIVLSKSNGYIAEKDKEDTRRKPIQDENYRIPDMPEEVWIIEKSDLRPQGKPYSTQPSLSTTIHNQKVTLPLKHTSVQAQISAFIAEVDVTQHYHNPYSTKIEAIYTFPLPQDAAVTDFIMTIGQRKIRGLIREKEEAQRIYQEARKQGKNAAILTQERPNVFKQKVANIEPGHQIDIQIKYFGPLKDRDGEYEFTFPTAVGPRFNPPGTPNPLHAQSYRHSKTGTNSVKYLSPENSSAHRFSMSLHIDGSVGIEKVYSPSHQIVIGREGSSRSHITLDPGSALPNKDFILRYKLSGKQFKRSFLVHRHPQGNTFALYLQAPESTQNLPRMPREMIFVLDCSGSMRGKPLEKAKAAIQYCLRNLDEDDTFQIIRFSNDASTFGPKPIAATRTNIRKAMRYVKRLNGGGGTMMIEGIKTALNFPHDKKRLRIVSFITDGHIGNETQILKEIQQRLGATRIFSFGIGSSVNRYLLERMAAFGRGAVAFVGLNDHAGKEVDLFYDRISQPALTDIQIDWGNMEVEDVYPKKIPDLFVGRPILITGKFKNNRDTEEIFIRGRVGKSTAKYRLVANLKDHGTQHSAISSLWARYKIRELSHQEIYRPSSWTKRNILNTSVEYGIMSQYTAFLAIDSLSKTQGDYGVSVDVPVLIPQGMRYETTVE